MADAAGPAVCSNKAHFDEARFSGTENTDMKWKSALWIVVLLSGVAVAGNEGFELEAGSVHEGSVTTRNGAIRIGDDATVKGDIESRNGLIDIGRGVTAANVGARNGPIRLGPESRVGDVESRNGAITLEDDGQAGRIETRNGAIRIGANAQAADVHSRNGSVHIAEAAVIEGHAETRNGSIDLAAESHVKGLITTRNGAVELNDARVGQGISTVAGDIVLRGASHSGGDLVIEVEENRNGGGLFGFIGKSSREAGDIRVLDSSEVDGDVMLLLPADYDGEIPTLEIAADARVTGNLRIDHRVELKIDGTVEGQVERITP